MRDYNLGLMQPGEEREINVFGNYIRNIGEGSIKVIARNKGKTVKAFSTVLGAGGWRSPESDYDHWVVTNESVVVIAVSLLIGKGEAGESEVQINANVNTRAANLTVDNNRFFAGMDWQAIPSNYSMQGIYNPVGSNVIGYIDILRLCAYGASARFFSVTEADYNANSWGHNTFCFNKNLNQVVSNAKLIAGWDVLQQGTSMNTSISTDASGTPASLDMKNSPIALGEGEGLLIGASVVNTKLSAYFEFWEE